MKAPSTNLADTAQHSDGFAGLLLAEGVTLKKESYVKTKRRYPVKWCLLRVYEDQRDTKRGRHQLTEKSSRNLTAHNHQSQLTEPPFSPKRPPPSPITPQRNLPPTITLSLHDISAFRTARIRERQNHTDAIERLKRRSKGFQRVVRTLNNQKQALENAMDDIEMERDDALDTFMKRCYSFYQPDSELLLISKALRHTNSLVSTVKQRRAYGNDTSIIMITTRMKKKLQITTLLRLSPPPASIPGALPQSFSALLNTDML